MKKVSEPAVARLSLYMRLLGELEAEGLHTASSELLARRGGLTAAQVRKDLSQFGSFGRRGQGYPVAELHAALRSILGLERQWRVGLVGVGKIGAALLGYDDFRRQGFCIEVAFDADPGKVGTRVNGVEVRPDAELEEVLKANPVDILIVAVPAAAAQPVVERAVASGVRAILNFAPAKLRLPAGIALRSVNLAIELEGLSFALANDARRNARGAGRTNR